MRARTNIIRAKHVLNPSRHTMSKLVCSVFCLTILMLIVAPANSASSGLLSTREKANLRKHFRKTLKEEKGPYGPNVCVCTDGRKEPVERPDGTISNVCKRTLFCAAFRAPWAEALAKRGVYIGNIFSSDLHHWDDVPDHHDMVRGYILEKYFVQTHPKHKLAKLKSYRGLSGAEDEIPAFMRFSERYLADDTFNDSRHFLLAYELQKRFFVSEDQGQIDKVRNLAVQVQQLDRKFKALKDAVHNQISASLIPELEAYRDRLPKGETRSTTDALIEQLTKVTSLNESALRPLMAKIENQELRSRLEALLPTSEATPLAAIQSLAEIMVLARRAVAQRSVAPGDARRLVELNVTTAAVIQNRGTTYLASDKLKTVKQHLQLMGALIDASYGVGILTERERKAAAKTLRGMLSNPTADRATFAKKLKQSEKVVEWAQTGALLAFAEVWPAWTYLLPDVALIGDDMLRGSPLLLLGQISTRLNDYVSGRGRVQHEVLGRQLSTGVRALNPGLAMGKLRVGPKRDGYSRNDVVALAETPSDLAPAAGIVTRGEGNLLSHVQLLAQALGIPNVVIGSEPFEVMKPFDGKDVFFVVTPGGRVYLKEVARMTTADHTINDEFNRNTEPGADGSLGVRANKLQIDRARLDLNVKLPLALAELGIKDSGVRSGPKAAYLGELKRLFPDHVARGVVLPFGVYYDHFQRAKVALPKKLRKSRIAKAGEPLPKFVERTYRRFFGEMIPAGTAEKELSAWIKPRLEIMQFAIAKASLSRELKGAIVKALDRQGLLQKKDASQTVGLFVRSDTNVEDLDNFNGAGLNLTLFNLRSLEQVYAGIKKVWASPFSFRSFSWRQTLIDEPMWVLPSIVILESVPSEKSGVLVTADTRDLDTTKMLVATSEGVGGAVDGTPAETLLWSPENVELLNMYKSPRRLMLKPGGGSELIASTGSEYVLNKDELESLISAATRVKKEVTPVEAPSGKARPWDIEFGFSGGKLWLFQVRPFVGNDELKNVPALAVLDGASPGPKGSISLEDVVK